jgi:integrase/recombinase XerD
LASCDRQATVGRRDFAIGAAGAAWSAPREVAGLALGDMNWRAGELIVRGKGDRHDRMPVPVDVGYALANYLEHGRPVNVPGRSVCIRAWSRWRRSARAR